ncbi:MAG: serine/threonine protein kinase [Mariniblastus sp.]
MTTNCPPDSDLRNLIDEKIGDKTEFHRLEQHLESCLQCQVKLDSWLATSSLVCGWNSPDETTITFDGNSESTMELLINQMVSQGPNVPPTLNIGKTIGKYQLLEQVGIGSSGIVYRALDVLSEREVAIKVLKQDLAESKRAIQRLQREARVAGGIDHPNVVKVFEVCVNTEDRLSKNSIAFEPDYLVMEFVKGDTLSQRIANRTTIAPREAANLAQQILLGLHASHQKDLVHRDLKSSNVLVETVDGIDNAKITDFGLVRETDSQSSLTRENVVAGTPAYMSPEQILCPHQVDLRADIYSVGVVMYEMLAGELPFRGSHRMVLKQSAHDQPPSLRRRDDSISEDLESICLKAMSKNPNTRYQSALAMHADIGRWLEGSHVNARQNAIAKRLAWCGDNWKTLASGALMGIGTTLAATFAILPLNADPAMKLEGSENSSNSPLVVEQRDKTLEALREIVITPAANKALKNSALLGNVSVEQRHLLQTALAKLKDLDDATIKNNLTDTSQLAIQNQMGDVCFLLHRFEKSEKHYEESLARSKRFDLTDENVEVLKQRLRSFEGLASIEFVFEDEQSAAKWKSSAEEVANQISSIAGEQTLPKYLVHFDAKLADREVQSLLTKLTSATSNPPTNVEQIKDVTEMVQTIGQHYLKSKEHQYAELCYHQVLTWLDSGEFKGLKGKIIWAQKTGRHTVLDGLSQIATAKGDEIQAKKFQRQSIDALPWGSKTRFHVSVREQAYKALDHFLESIEHDPPKKWANDYYRYFGELIELKKANNEPLPPTNLRACEVAAQHIRQLVRVGEESKAKKQWASLIEMLDGLDLSSVPAKHQRRLKEELIQLESHGFKRD